MNERKDRSKMDLRIFFPCGGTLKCREINAFCSHSLLLIDEYNLNAAFLAAIRKDMIV